MIPLYLSGFKEKIEIIIRPTQGHTYKEFMGGGGVVGHLQPTFYKNDFVKA